jgi:Asp-tRNA(Asn)/Glu-tRNA(Gln) amidotransferase A subunit family amidase
LHYAVSLATRIRMTYDLTPIHAPRAAGWTLRVLTSLVESRITGPLLSRRILGDAGILAMRSVPADEPLSVGPPLPGTAASNALAPGESLSTKDLEPATGTAGEGFRFETAADFAAAYRSRECTPLDVAERVLDWTQATEQHTPAMRIFIHQQEADVRAQAEASAKRWASGTQLGPLDGIPVAVKDELDQKGYRTTVGTRFLGAIPASEDATVVARLRAAGAILIGKTNMHEMGMGVTGLNPHHGACRNPYDPSRAPGGSSSGPAAAVAVGLCPIAVGADGGGSIRIPAALCGVVGLKPTFGRVSEHGAAPLCWSVAHVGPIAATVRDAALGYAMMAGPDARDGNTLKQPNPSLRGLNNQDLSGVRIGIYDPWFRDADDEVVARCVEAVDRLVAAGAERCSVEIPELGLLRAVHLVTIVSEMASAHARYFPAHRRDYGCDTRLNLALARSLKATDYVQAQQHRRRLCAHFQRVLSEVDVLVTPATGCTAPLIPEDALVTGESNLVVTERVMRFSPPANLTGLPALSVPVGADGAGLPVGLQLLGRPWDEALLLRLGSVVERESSCAQPTVYRRLLS